MYSEQLYQKYLNQNNYSDNLKWPIVYCETNKCLRSAVSFKLSMNRSVDPCEDFFKFACGRWQHHHPLYPNQKRTSRFSQTENSINFVVQRFLSATHNNDDILPVKQSKLFYQSCLNRKSEYVCERQLHCMNFSCVIGVPKGSVWEPLLLLSSIHQTPDHMVFIHYINNIFSWWMEEL